jgi:hypothetical protein
MKKSILLFFMLASVVVVAQRRTKKEKAKDTIKPEVITVITSYTPTIADAFKIKKTPKIVLSDKTRKQKLSYQIFSAPVASTFVPKSGVVKGIDVGKKERLFDNYVAAGYGNYNTPFVEAFLHQNRKFEDDFGIYLKYISSEDGVETTPLDNGYKNITVGAYYMQEARYFTWKLGGNLQQDTYNWYGLPAITFDAETIASIAEEQSYGFYELEGELLFEDSYINDIKASLSMFDDKFGSQEIRFSLKPNFELPLTRINRRWNDLNLKTEIEYLGGEFEQTYTTNDNIAYSFLNVGLNPTYRFEWKDFNIKLGTKLFLSLDTENSLTNFLAYPDIQVTYPLVSKLVNVYAGAGGDLHMNSFQSLSKNNPFVSPTLLVTTTNEQYNLYGGINGKFSSDVSFDIRASYKTEEDKPLFVRNNSLSNGVFDPFSDPLLGFRFGNSFSVLYDDITTLSVFGELEIDLTKSMVIGGNVQFNSFTTTNQREAWNLPQLEGGIFGKYKNDKWYATANIFFVGERQDLNFPGTFPLASSGIQTLEAFTDINLNGGYHFNDFVSVFVKLNNILNNDYERFANFNVQGFQVLGGVTYKFDF